MINAALESFFIIIFITLNVFKVFIILHYKTQYNTAGFSQPLLQ